MWNYEKRLEYPINIKRTDAAMAKAIISQFGGPDGETGAAMRYLSQRFAMPYRPVMGVLTDVGIEASNRNLPQAKHSPRRESNSYICGLGAKVGCERFYASIQPAATKVTNMLYLVCSLLGRQLKK